MTPAYGVSAWWGVKFWASPLTGIVAFTTLSHYRASVWFKTTKTKWYMAYWIVASPLTLVDIQGHFSYFCLKISVEHRERSLIESPGDLTKDDVADNLKWHLKVIFVYYKRFHCMCLKDTAFVVYELQRSNVVCDQLFLLSYSTGWIEF